MAAYDQALARLARLGALQLARRSSELARQHAVDGRLVLALCDHEAAAALGALDEADARLLEAPATKHHSLELSVPHNTVQRQGSSIAWERLREPSQQVAQAA
ncbi:MAG: hypothetical protein ACI9MC_000752 [Kiritimatiellia bacterium]|jgi:hypothetical protein